MTGIQRRDAPDLTEWSARASIQRWCTGLRDMTGLTPAEVANRQEALWQFCLSEGIDPEVMAEECRRGKDRVSRRAFYLRVASTTPASLIVQSFLVHNGVNVFGDLVCMPSTRQQIVAEQGQQWLHDTGRTSLETLDGEKS